MQSFPKLQPLLLSDLQQKLKLIADDYVDKLRLIYTPTPVDDSSFRVSGMSRKTIGETPDSVYLRFVVESYQRYPDAIDPAGNIVTYHPIEVRYYIALTIRHLRDDGGTFDEITYRVGYNENRMTEIGIIQAFPNPFILYDLWERIKGDLGSTLFDSPEADTNLIQEKEIDPTGDNAVKRPDIG